MSHSPGAYAQMSELTRQSQSPQHTSTGGRETMIEKQKVNNKESVNPGRRIQEMQKTEKARRGMKGNEPCLKGGRGLPPPQK